MTKEDEQNFRNPTKYCICNNSFVEGYLKIIDQNYATAKHSGEVHINCNINFILNYKTNNFKPMPYQAVWKNK